MVRTIRRALKHDRDVLPAAWMLNVLVESQLPTVALFLLLAPGDMLVVVTDGFYEWGDPSGEQFGLSRLEAVIRASRDDSAAGMIKQLRVAVDSFCKGTKQQDDLTAVILKRKAGI